MIRLVCFDLGRVLIRLCDTLPAACQAAGVNPPEHSDDPERRRVFMELLDRHERGQIGPDPFIEQFADLLALAPEQARCVWSAWLAGRFPGTLELLEQLIDRDGLQIACLSNTSAWHWRLMNDRPSEANPNALPLHAFDYRFASHLIGWRKPETAIYEHVEKHIDVAGRHILFFDDRHDNIESAAKRGWRTCHVPPCQNPLPIIRQSLADHAILEPAHP